MLISADPACADVAQASEVDGAAPRVTFGSLPDPAGRYSSLKENEAYRRYQMCILPVFDIDGNIVEPSKYKDAIPDGSLVAVRGKLKMYVLSCSHSLPSIVPLTFWLSQV